MFSARLLVSITVAVGVTLARCPVRADTSAFRECDVVNGQVNSCGSWYQGRAVTWSDGAFRECTIVNGQSSGCGPWHQGSVIAHRDGAYRECDVVTKRSRRCWSSGG